MLIPGNLLWCMACGQEKNDSVRIIEREIQLLIDKNKIQQAKDLLLSTPWQKVHQTYTRTGWEQICEKLGINYLPIPQQLCEDRLARFGAYREYE